MADQNVVLDVHLQLLGLARWTQADTRTAPTQA